MGISFLPKYATLPILQEKNLALFTVAGFDIKMDLLIFYHRQKWVTPAMKKVDKQWAREVVAVGVFVVALCAVCAFMNGTGYVPFSVVC